MSDARKDEVVAIKLWRLEKQVKDLQKENQELRIQASSREEVANKYKEVMDRVKELLGNYKHYSTPSEKQNTDNEDLVNKAFDINNRFDLKTRVGKYTVSTVDLGINHQFEENLPPLYYETMIFNCKDETGNPFEYYQERYTTEKQAREGHKKAVKYVKEKLKEVK